MMVSFIEQALMYQIAASQSEVCRFRDEVVMIVLLKSSKS